MLKGLLATIAAATMIAVFSVLVMESRAVGEDDYIAHAERMRSIETSRDDIIAIVDGSRSAFEVGRMLSTSTESALVRLTESNASLQGLDPLLLEDAGIRETLAAYDVAVGNFISDGRVFVEKQSAFADALRTMQEESPILVKDLRRFNLRLESQNVFSLALGVIEYATGVGDASANQLRERIDGFRNDRKLNAKAPGTMKTFVDAATEVVDQREAAEIALSALTSSTVSESLWSLSNAVLDDNRRRVSRAERAGLLLSICAGLLLLGTGYAMWRLQASYRDLNQTNDDLEQVNNSLEERVDERTHELSEAYDELKESQVQLVQAEKMSSLGELVAGISHEINTPLWYLISNSTVLQERMETISALCTVNEEIITAVRAKEDLKPVLKKGIAEMAKLLDAGLRDDIDEASDLIGDSIEGLEELTELAQSLKDFSRMDRAREGEMDVHDGINKTLLIAKNKLKNKVTVHKHFGELPTIHCSPSQINQVFLNLLTNAADAIEETGDVVIQTKVVDDGVRISFADTGSGIPDDVMAKIRDPFFTTKEVGKGTGLGLSIVDQIVTAHGGELLIESESGKGTTVTVCLPLRAEEPANDPDSELEADAEIDADADASAEADVETDVESANDEDSPEPEAA
ncbi:MAG: HAMP domain-containing sensor histidine kinase [Woeseiaceae bacterium]|nr:HAMP domain-containing sensor histidine kinase [Woeseiaceae bacterium]